MKTTNFRTVEAQNTLRKPIQGTSVIWHANRCSPELISYEEVTGWLYLFMCQMSYNLRG